MYGLVDEILKVGVENVLFMAPMRPLRRCLVITYTSSEDKPVLVPAVVVQRRYKLAENYKLELGAVYEGFGSESFYVTDLTSLIERGQVQMFVRPEKFRAPNTTVQNLIADSE